MKNFRPTALVLPLFALAAAAGAQTIPLTEATDNATVRTTGPRTGAGNHNFFNVEGSANGTASAFASYGVADFTGLSGLAGATSVSSVIVELTESNAAFSLPGGLAFYLVSNETANLEPGTSPLFYDTTQGEPGFGSQLGTSYFLGNGTFNTTGATNNGQVDTFTFTPDAATSSFILSSVTDGTLRLVVAPTTATAAATYAGFANSTLSGPRLSVVGAQPVPEPASLAAVAVGLVGFARRRRRA